MAWNISQSDHNRDSNRYLAQANPAYRDWEITTLFYSALHMVNSYLFLVKRCKPRTHLERRRLVHSQLNDISSEYKLLERLSKKARYVQPHHGLTSGEGRSAVEYHTKIVTFIQDKLRGLGLV